MPEEVYFGAGTDGTDVSVERDILLDLHEGRITIKVFQGSSSVNVGQFISEH